MNEERTRVPQRDDCAFRSRFDWSESSPTEAVIETVAVVTDQEPTDLPHLHAHIDPGALNAILEPGRGTVEDGEVSVTFPYGNTGVTVSSDGEVVVGTRGEVR